MYDRRMKRRTSAGFTGLLIFGWLLLSGPIAEPGGGGLLVSLQKAGLDRLPDPLARLILVHTELESGWIATLPAEMAGILRLFGVSFEILDRSPAGKPYFLVETFSVEEGVSLARFGWAKPLDRWTTLFRTIDGREAREALPAEFRIKSLSLETGLSLLDTASPSAGRVMGHLFRPPVYDPRIAALVAQVSKTALSANIQALQNFQTRYASTGGCELAAEFLYSYFSALGLTTETDPFTFSNSIPARNIVATLPGTASPEYAVIVCAHYDSISGASSLVFAPGADDNASGVAAVMEIARVLAGRPFDFTLKFICFSAEEWGLYGSKHFAQEAAKAGQKILAVLNMDMIAYPDVLPEDLDLFTDSRSEWLASRFTLCARQYAAIGLAPVVNPSVRASDHSPFWDQGYSALLAIEDYPVRNPYYHKTTDLFTSLNMDLAEAVTKVALAVACGLAQPGLQ
jgi:hypothetical protein